MIWLDLLEKGQIQDQTKAIPTSVGLLVWILVLFGLSAMKNFPAIFFEFQHKEQLGQVLFSLLWTKQKKKQMQ